MNLLQLISKNNLFKFSLFFITIFLISFNAQSEIPKKYKIKSSLKKCKETDYKKWNNCYGEYKFPRIEYKGEWKNGKLHGKGILKEAWGGIYVGDFKNNLANGNGKQEDPDGSWWEGEIKNDKLNGKGIYVNSRGHIYKGLFKDNMLNGPGIFTTPEGDKVSGNFENDYLNGLGKWKYANGDIAEGNFKDDSIDGFAIYIWANGDKYEGNWVKGYREGKGKYTYKNGNIYEGEYLNNKSEGNGTLTFYDGTKYVGKFKNDLYHGDGTATWEDGSKYTGGWKEGERHGKGKYEYSNGNVYDGPWEKGLENGFGIFIWSDGEIYEGNWVDGYREGKGKYTYKSGTVYEGNFVENIAEGNGKIIYSDGTKYTGEFKDGNEHGQGSVDYANGDKYLGQFEDGYKHGQGKMVYANGDVYDGLWEDGVEAEGKTTLAKFTTDEKYYALIIGNNNYEKLDDLDNAVNDAKDLEKVLREKYGFETTILIDEKSDETENAIIKFTKNRDKNDNILIYYAGHGELIKKQKRGYWLPTDAGSTQDSKWLSNNNIKDLISASDAKHILLVVDSCFSGSLMRGSGENKSVEKITATSIKRYQQKKTRLVMTSGGNEQVVDGIGNSDNSVFAEPLIKSLRDNNQVIRSIELFQKVRNYVENNADQTPEHSLIHGTGHDGGEFLFFPIN